MAYLLSQFANRHDVTLVTWEAAGTPSFYALPQSIRIVQAELLGGTGWLDRGLRILARFAAIRREARRFRPEVALSFMDTMNIATIVGCLGSGIPVIVSERVDPTRHRIGAWKSLSRRWLYPLADCCVVQTERVKMFFKRAPRPRLVVIPNPVLIPAHQARPGTLNGQGRFRIVALGRLEQQKGFDLLMDAFVRLAPSYPDWELVVFGEGSARKALESRIRAHELTGRVRLPGVTADAATELAASHIIAFPSRFEGFPNALAEGMAVGLPAVGHIEVSGVEELIIDNATGLLVDPAGGSPALADALRRLMDNPGLRVDLGAQARRHMERWRSDAIYERWEACLASVATKNSP